MTAGMTVDELVLDMLRDRCRIDPDRLGDVLDLAAVGLVNGVWRNSPVEDWHACDVRLGDGAMLRINAHTTWRVREIVRRWRVDLGLGARSSTTVLDDLDPGVTDGLAMRVFRWMVNPKRRLPIGIMLGELAGDRLADFVEHADRALGSFAGEIERGPSSALRRTAAHGGMACTHWWGTTGWPDLVALFLDVIDDKDHEHWRLPGADRVRAVRPAQVEDRVALGRTLLRRPWELDPAVADWVVVAGIGYLRDRARSGPPL